MRKSLALILLVAATTAQPAIVQSQTLDEKMTKYDEPCDPARKDKKKGNGGVVHGRGGKANGGEGNCGPNTGNGGVVYGDNGEANGGDHNSHNAKPGEADVRLGNGGKVLGKNGQASGGSGNVVRF
jgi:hypothetical protein